MINWSIHSSHGRLLPPNPFPEQQRIHHVCGTEQSVEDRQRLPVVHSTVPQIRGGFRIFHSGCWTAAVPEEGVALDNMLTYFVYIIIIVMNITHILPHTFSWYFSYPTLLLMSKMGGGGNFHSLLRWCSKQLPFIFNVMKVYPCIISIGSCIISI